MEIIEYKGQFGTVQEEVQYNEVSLANVMRTTIYTGYHKPVVGEIVYLSSCEIPYHDNWRDCWNTSVDEDEFFSDVVIELVEYDGSNYEPLKSHNGGKYLESTWKIVAIEGIHKFKEM